MEEKILALLETKFQGVRKDGLGQLARAIALQAATEEEAKPIIEKLTKAQVDKYVKDFRADVDKEVSNGNKTFETNLKEKFDLVEKGKTKPNNGGGEPNPDDLAGQVASAVAKAIQPLQDELDKYKQGDIAKTRLQTLTDKLKDCKDETFNAKALKDFGRMQFDSDEAFTEYLTDTEADIATANQNVANSTLGGISRPYTGNGGADKKEASKEEIEAVLDKLPI